MSYAVGILLVKLDARPQEFASQECAAKVAMRSLIHAYKNLFLSWLWISNTIEAGSTELKQVTV